MSPSRVFFRLCFAVGALGSASAAAPASEGPPPIGRTTLYACDNGSTIGLTPVGGRMRLTDNRGATVMLAQRPAQPSNVSGASSGAPSGDSRGVSYQGRGNTVRADGADLTWTVATRVPRHCRATETPQVAARPPG